MRGVFLVIFFALNCLLREPLLWGNLLVRSSAIVFRVLFLVSPPPCFHGAFPCFSAHAAVHTHRISIQQRAPLPVGAHEVSCQHLFHLTCCWEGGQGLSAGHRQTHGRLRPDWTAINIINKKKTSMFVFLMAPQHVCSAGWRWGVWGVWGVLGVWWVWGGGSEERLKTHKLNIK